MRMRSAVFIGFLTLAGMSAPFPASAAPLTAADALATLAESRTEAETCVAVIKARGDAADRAAAELDYMAARAASAGLLEGLAAAAAQCRKGDALPDMAARLHKLTANRDRLCDRARTLIPPKDGSKGWWLIAAEIVGSTIAGKLLEAAYDAIFEKVSGDKTEQEACKNLQSRLAGRAWPAFADIKPGGEG